MTTFYSATGLATPPTMLVDEPPLIAPPAGGRQMLDMSGLGEEVVHAGNCKRVDFAVHSHIFTRGLFQCIAICAVWNKQGGAFQDGFLAHVGSPKHSLFRKSVGLIDPAGAFVIPEDAFVACDVGPGLWGAELAEALEGRVPAANIWIYIRPNSKDNVGFGIDKYGRFGEVL
jgi:hypothetical protein